MRQSLFNFWHLMVKFGCNKWFYGHFQNRFFFCFGEINRLLFWVFQNKKIQFFWVGYYISKYIKIKKGEKKNLEKIQNNNTGQYGKKIWTDYEQLLRAVFSCFLGQKKVLFLKIFWNFFLSHNRLTLKFSIWSVLFT